jgi:hypothetical protein
MAKKTRTPAPPRKVQAPQRRSDPKRPRTGGGSRGWLWIVLAAALVVAAAIVGGAYFFTRGGNDVATPKVPTNSNLVGLQVGQAPWNAGLDTLPDRLGPLGLNDLTTEGQVVHIHQHLDVFVNGKHEPVPANIGIYDGQFLTELHTHDPTGIMHVESPTKREFDLGQFFGVWGVRLNSNCVGGYCKPVYPWNVYVNGERYAGNPAALVLQEHQEIAFVIGTPPRKIPSSYKFPAGL